MSSRATEPDWSLEEQVWACGAARVAGVDEAGRGALCGPVVAAAVILPPRTRHAFRDSKTVSAARREALASRVRADAVAFGVGFASAAEVDALNVLRATQLAARRALAALHPPADGLVTDYLRLGASLPEVAVAAADARSYQVAAASILAKVARDAYMVELAAEYPGYGFERHKGYGVRQHLRALAELGPTPEHRLSFAPLMRAPLFGDPLPAR